MGLSKAYRSGWHVVLCSPIRMFSWLYGSFTLFQSGKHAGNTRHASFYGMAKVWFCTKGSTRMGVQDGEGQGGEYGWWGAGMIWESHEVWAGDLRSKGNLSYWGTIRVKTRGILWGAVCRRHTAGAPNCSLGSLWVLEPLQKQMLQLFS